MVGGWGRHASTAGRLSGCKPPQPRAHQTLPGVLRQQQGWLAHPLSRALQKSSAGRRWLTGSPTPFMAQMGMATARLCVEAKAAVQVAHSQQPMAITVPRGMKWPAGLRMRVPPIAAAGCGSAAGSTRGPCGRHWQHSRHWRCSGTHLPRRPAGWTAPASLPACRGAQGTGRPQHSRRAAPALEPSSQPASLHNSALEPSSLPGPRPTHPRVM